MEDNNSDGAYHSADETPDQAQDVPTKAEVNMNDSGRSPPQQAGTESTSKSNVTKKSKAKRTRKKQDEKGQSSTRTQTPVDSGPSHRVALTSETTESRTGQEDVSGADEEGPTVASSETDADETEDVHPSPGKDPGCGSSLVSDENPPENLEVEATTVTEASHSLTTDNVSTPEPENECLSPCGEEMNRSVPETTDICGEAGDASSSERGLDAPQVKEEHTFTGALSSLTGERFSETKPASSGWGWGGWGASFVSSVSSMGQSLGSVIENVETSLGVPKPEQLTDQEKEMQQYVVAVSTEEEEEMTEEVGLDQEKADINMEADVERPDVHTPADSITPEKTASSMHGLLSLGASAVTSVLGRTVTGGLDALESIGRKTMDALQEGDHHGGTGRKQAGNKTNLSEMLRDAKEKAEAVALEEEEEREQQRAHFGILFDQYQGLAHLEALEMLSNQSEGKVQSSLSVLSGDELQSLKIELIEIRDAFRLEEMEAEEQPEGSEGDFVNVMTEHLFGVSVASTPDKLQRVQQNAHNWLIDCRRQQEAGERQDIKELHIKAIETLAEFSSRVVEQFHKACELMLLGQDQERLKSAVQQATSLSKLTSVLVAEVSNLASKFGDCLNREGIDGETDDDINPLITNVFVEASNSTSYIQDAFQLVLPILQVLTVEREEHSPSPTEANA